MKAVVAVVQWLVRLCLNALVAVTSIFTRGKKAPRYSPELVRELAGRSVRPPKVEYRLSDERFEAIGNEIRGGLEFLQKHGKVTVEAWGKLTASVLARADVSQATWCDEVWMRSGCKDCTDYNHTKRE